MKVLANQPADHHPFLNPHCTRLTIDNFVPRRAILNALTRHLRDFQGTVLDIGCGRMPYKPILVAPPSRATKYIGLDLDPSGRIHTYDVISPDLVWDGRTIPLASNSVQTALATEVITYCEDVEVLMREAARVLAPGGLFFFTALFFWAISDSPRDQYRYTPFAIQRHLKNSGFEQINMQALGGWDASLAQMIGLWVGRRPMKRGLKRRILSTLAVPLVKHLFKRDKPPQLPNDADGMMILGIAGAARKPQLVHESALAHGSKSHEAV